MNFNRKLYGLACLFSLLAVFSLHCSKNRKDLSNQKKQKAGEGKLSSHAKALPGGTKNHDPSSPEHDEGLLFEMLLETALKKPSGMRVYEDGLYRYMKGKDEWNDVWYFTAEEMKELKEAIGSANVPALKAHYKSTVLVSDGTTTRWRIKVNGRLHEITVEPGAKVPALDKLYKTLSSLRKLSPEKSHWQVWQPGGSYKKFTVKGSVNAVDALRPLIGAMFVPGEASGKPAEVSPETLLVKTDWIMEEKTEQTRLYADGRYIREVDGVKQEEKTLTPGQVYNVLNSICAIDWSAVPKEIDTN